MSTYDARKNNLKILNSASGEEKVFKLTSKTALTLMDTGGHKSKADTKSLTGNQVLVIYTPAANSEDENVVTTLTVKAAAGLSADPATTGPTPTPSPSPSSKKKASPPPSASPKP